MSVSINTLAVELHTSMRQDVSGLGWKISLEQSHSTDSIRVNVYPLPGYIVTQRDRQKAYIEKTKLEKIVNTTNSLRSMSVDINLPQLARTKLEVL